MHQAGLEPGSVSKSRDCWSQTTYDGSKALNRAPGAEVCHNMTNSESAPKCSEGNNGTSEQFSGIGGGKRKREKRERETTTTDARMRGRRKRDVSWTSLD